ncbi:hypothetical protein ACHAXA_001997 [Cyclostephanos tholiformis]|uniref:Uncharacterized protein n=1 Tax=Cyclostephanos tholiformis TaxID=382380 RepID=A0ABD3RZL6_9STRA
MPRFSDKWVIDKCMFDYVNGGDCACCGFPHLFAPGGIEGLINAMSDLETDDATREIKAANVSPWPPDMRDQIWSDRLLLRFKMKKEMRGYRDFLERVAKNTTTTTTSTDGDDDTTGGGGREEDDEDYRSLAVSELHRFCTRDLTPWQLRRIFQLPRSELGESLKGRYKICSAYSVLFCSVVDQVANFNVTGYGVDARLGRYENESDDTSEEEFEGILKFDRNYGFRLDVVVQSSTSSSIVRRDVVDDDGSGNDCAWRVDDAALLKFLRRMASLAGPTLLARAARKTANEGDDAGGNGSDENSRGGGQIDKDDDNVTSFRSDRRVIRLMIARYWADRLIEKYDEIQKDKRLPSPSSLSITPPI